MPKRIDIAGQVIGNWKVLYYIGDRKYKCQCLKCGALKDVQSYKIRYGTSTQCFECAAKNRIKKSNMNITQAQSECINQISELLKNNNILYTSKESEDHMSYDFSLSEYNIILSLVYTKDNIFDKKRIQDLVINYRKNNIRYISIFEYEWRNEIKRNKLIKLIIRNTTKHCIKRIYARKTNLIELNNSSVRNFLDDNHLQGYISSNINIGLTYDNEIVALMTFGRPRFGGEDGYELLRLAFKYDVEIIGGSKKLFNYFIKTYNPTMIISFCAITKFEGRVYNELGFDSKNKEVTPPNYFWVEPNSNDALPRYTCMKQKLIDRGWGTAEETEDSIMRKHGYCKVYDAGNEKYTWINTNYTNNYIEDEWEF